MGYFLRENAVGGGQEFYVMEWPIIQSLKTNFLYTIVNYKHFIDFTMPFPHMANAYLNPFSDNIENFQLFNTFVSFGIFLILFFVLKKVFFQINNIDALLISSVILLLPFFRTSAFWGKQENYGWLFLILAYYFFFEIKKNISNNPSNKDLIHTILFCSTSALALYSRQALFFLPISYLLYLFINNSHKKIIILSIVSFTILSIPGFLLIWIWGGIFPELPQEHFPGEFFGWWIHPMHVLKNIPILFSYIAFYLMPILIIELFHSGFKQFSNRYFKSFIFALVVFVFLSQINLLDYFGEYTKAGGAILKVNYLIQKKNFLLLLLFSSIGFSILFRFFLEDRKNNIVILLPILIIYGFPELLYQEYVEPLILIVFFLGLKTDLHKLYFKNISFSNSILILYFAVYLVGSIYFKHFAFDSYEKWIIFLNAQ